MNYQIAEQMADIQAKPVAVFQTRNGTLFDFLNPTVKMIHLSDIAAGLAGQCRYNGHLALPGDHYSVAEHCCILADYVLEQTGSADLALMALLHDAAEAYVGDMVADLKAILPEFQTIEKAIEKVIFKWAGLDHLTGAIGVIKEFDRRILVDERAALLVPGNDEYWAALGAPLGIKIYRWHSGQAIDEYMRRFNLLKEHNGNSKAAI